MRTCAAGWLMLAVLLGPAETKPAEPVKLGKPIDFPNVGLRIALPAAAAQGPLHHPAGLLLSWQRKDPPAECTKLYGYPFYHDRQIPSLQEWAERVAAASVSWEPKLQRTTISSGRLRFGKLPAWQVVSRLSKDKQVRVEAWTVLAVQRPKHKLTFYFPLGVCIGRDDADLTRARAKAICESVRTIPVRSPAEVPLGPPVLPVEVKPQGFRMKVPVGWFVQMATPTPERTVVLHAAAVDHLRRKRLPFLSVAVEETQRKEPPDVTSKAYAKGVVAHLEKQLWKAEWSLIATLPAKLGGRDALQIASRFKQEGPDYCQVQRQAFRGRKFYTLAVMYPGRDPKPALAAMDKLAGTFEFVAEPATRPAATRPANIERPGP